jgi:aconitate hydratase
VGAVLEYAGPGLDTLSVPERATITNMGTECGVTTSVFPSDAVTRAFMKAQGREKDWRELTADPDATYAKTVELDLAALEPLAAAPHSPDHVVTVASLAGMAVQQVLVGSCTNSSVRDIQTVARILKGRPIDAGVSFGVAPGSRQVLAMAVADGSLAALIDSGARILESACGFCIGNSMSPSTDAVSLRTSNRNFEGRSGTASGRVYLVSPPVAALAALRGRVVDPLKETEVPYPEQVEPKAFRIDDSLFIAPPADGATVTVVRGPNIGAPPNCQPYPKDIAGSVLCRLGDKITTDHIMPAGARLKFRSNIPAYSRYVFEPVDAGFAKRAGQNRDAGLHNFIVAGESYGQGSSREHAAICPMFLGVKAVVAKSIERIHTANLINFGIMPLVFENPADYDKIAADDRLSIGQARGLLERGEAKVTLRNDTKGVDIPLVLNLTGRQRKILLAGGLLNIFKS